MQLLLSHGAKVRGPEAADSDGRTPLAYAMTLDKIETLECARMLLAAGSKTTMPGPGNTWDEANECWTKPEIEIMDLIGETFAHRAVRYGGWDCQ